MVPERLVVGAVLRQRAGRQQQQRALRVRRMREQLAALPGDAQRRRRLGAVRGQVVERHPAPAGAQRGDDALRDRPGVERVGAAAADRSQRLGEVGVALHVAGAREPTTRQKDRRRRTVGAEHRLVERDVVRDDVGHRDAVARVPLRRREQLVESARPVDAPDVFPRAHPTGDRDRQRAALRQHAAGELVERRRARRAAARVVRGRPARLRVVDDPERVAAEPAAGRIDDSQHRVGGDRGVDGVAAAAQDVDARGGRLGVRGGDHRAGRPRDRAGGPAGRGGIERHARGVRVRPAAPRSWSAGSRRRGKRAGWSR